MNIDGFTPFTASWRFRAKLRCQRATWPRTSLAVHSLVDDRAEVPQPLEKGQELADRPLFLTLLSEKESVFFILPPSVQIPPPGSPRLSVSHGLRESHPGVAQSSLPALGLVTALIRPIPAFAIRIRRTYHSILMRGPAAPVVLELGPERRDQRWKPKPADPNREWLVLHLTGMAAHVPFKRAVKDFPVDWRERR
ncbi:MAG: hypothetical protein MZV70_67935 [Desulfobacterales bacterium]|nr:hypothetical protein [Desulfobacterales bacterium]